MSREPKLSHGGDLEWAVWKRGEKIFSIPAKRAAEQDEEAKAPRPEDYTFVGR